MNGSLIDDLLGQLQGAPASQIAQQLGTDPNTAQDAIAAALPMIVGALGRNAQQPGGATDLFSALQRDHGAGAGGMDLGSMLGGLLGGGNAGGLGGLGGEDVPNTAQPIDADLKRRLVPALDAAAKRMADQHRVFSQEAKRRTGEELARLDALRQQHLRQLELDFRSGEDAMAHLRERKKQQQAQDTERLFHDYREWVSRTLELDARAQLTVAAVLIA